MTNSFRSYGLVAAGKAKVKLLLFFKVIVTMTTSPRPTKCANTLRGPAMHIQYCWGVLRAAVGTLLGMLVLVLD